MIITDLYKQLFGKKGIADGNVIDMSEHGRVGGVSTGQPFKFVTPIDPDTGSTLTPTPAITGFATSAKQLPDNHKVTVDNIASTPVITGFATSALQTQPGVDIGDVTINNSGTTNAVNIQDGGNTITVDGTVAVSNMIPAVETGLATSANQTNGAQRTQIRDQYGFTGDATPNSEIMVANKIRLVGAIFNGATVDSNFWTSTVSTGTVTQASSELVLTSGTANGHYAKVHSVRRANWITGTSNKFRTQCRFESSDNDVTVRFGVGWGATMPTITDGAYFKLVGSTLSVNTMANTSETSVTVFNGTYVAPTLTNNNTYEILYTLGKVYFLINNVIIHTATFATTHWTNNTTNFHIFADVTNTGNSDAIKHIFRMMNICRLGAIITKATYKYISGAATTVCKLGGGVLHSIVVNQAGTLCTMYDQTSGAVPLIGILDTNKTTGTIGSVNYECPFFNGLTIVTTGAGSNITVIYE